VENHSSRVEDSCSTGDVPATEVPIDLTYKVGGTRFMEMIETVGARNQQNLKRAIGDDLALASHLLDDLHAIASHYIPWLIGFPGTVQNPASRLLLTCFHKSLINLGCALSLTERGFYGPARPLMRQAFEAVVIGKFSSVTKSTRVHDNWFDGRDVYLTPDVFNRIKSPSPSPMRGFWRELSTVTHATIYASQIKLAIRDEEGLRELWLNLAFLAVIAECLYHLLLTHLVTKSARYFQGFYANKEEPRRLAFSFKNDLRSLKHKLLTPFAIKVAANYRAAWVTA
jgi:hypothetical protein